jgi:hypothetical protein
MGEGRSGSQGMTRVCEGTARAASSVITPPQPQHPHRQIELRDSPSGVQQFEPHPRQHVEDDADRQKQMSLLLRIDLSIFQ